jgi:hypothetical protein
MWLVERNAILTKDNLIKKIGMRILHAISVTVMKTLTIFLYNAPLPKSFGVWWHRVLGLAISHTTGNRSYNG